MLASIWKNTVVKNCGNNEVLMELQTWSNTKVWQKSKKTQTGRREVWNCNLSKERINHRKNNYLILGDWPGNCLSQITLVMTPALGKSDLSALLCHCLLYRKTGPKINGPYTDGHISLCRQVLSLALIKLSCIWKNKIWMHAEKTRFLILKINSNSTS